MAISQQQLQHDKVEGTKGRRRARPNTTCRCTVEKESNRVGWQSWKKVPAVAGNRER